MSSVKIGSAYCSVCGRQVKCERREGFSSGSILFRLFLTCFFLAVPGIGMFFSILSFISIFWNGAKGKWHCSFCGSVLEKSVSPPLEERMQNDSSDDWKWPLICFVVLSLLVVFM